MATWLEKQAGKAGKQAGDPIEAANEGGGKFSKGFKGGGRKTGQWWQKITGAEGRAMDKSSKSAAEAVSAADRQAAIDKFIRGEGDQPGFLKRMESLYDDKSGRGKDVRDAISGIKGIDLSDTNNAYGGTIDRLNTMAKADGLSAQGLALTDRQRAEEAAGIENLQTQAGTEAASAYSNLAQQGGASAGARERLGGSLGTQSLFQQQAQRRAGQLSRLGISSEDEARKYQAGMDAAGLYGKGSAMNMQAAGTRAGMLQNQGQYETGGLQNALGFEGSVFGAENLSQDQLAFLKGLPSVGGQGIGIAGSAYSNWKSGE